MLVSNEMERVARMGDFKAEDAAKEADEAKKARANRDFTQVYPKGWRRIQVLIQESPAAARLYAFLAEHIDGAVGAVVVSQDVMALELGISTRTVKRQTAALEEMGALVRIRIGTGVYAYALDPQEVWKSWDDRKDTAAFVTKTLVRKSDVENGSVKRKLNIMVSEGKAGLD